MFTQETELTSFDGTERVNGFLARPERYRDLFARMEQAGAFIPRGAGLSYSAASFGEGVLSLDMKRFDRVLAFDARTGVIDIEPGMCVGDLIEFLAPRGYCLPVVPGYPRITVGGCVAFDVHGKSQFHSDNFGAWVEELELFHPSHGLLRLSRERDAEVFELTLGGMGLTGMITRVRLRTEPLAAPGIELATEPVANLEHAVQVMESRAADASALYSWHNFTRRGKRFGEGFVFIERFVPGSAKLAPKRPRFSLETRLPAALWNRVTSAMALGVYQRLQSARRPRLLDLRRGFFPLEGLEGYYAAFGRRGFREYQVIVPRDAWSSFSAACADLFHRRSIPATLASLKLFRGKAKYLRFRGAGVCLAVDVPATPASLELFAELDRLALASGATVNLSKDSRIDADHCRRSFPEYSEFASAVARFDPERRCRSRLRERIGV